MPIDRESFKEKTTLRMKPLIFEFMRDGKGYMIDEIVVGTRCSYHSARAVLNQFLKQGIAEGATAPDEGTGNKKYYSLTDKALEQVGNHRTLKAFFRFAEIYFIQ